MDARAADLTVYGYALATLAYAGFAGYLLHRSFLRRHGERASAAFFAAVLASALWAAASLWDTLSHKTAPAYLASMFDLARYGLWFTFLLLLLRPQAATVPLARENGWLTPTAGMLVGLGAISLAIRFVDMTYEADESRLALGCALGLAVFGLLLVEQLFRNLPDDSRWNAKPVCLGLAFAFIFDVYLFSEALLFGRFDRDALSIRGGVHLLAVPLLLVAAQRRTDWIRTLQVSRRAAFYSATLLMAGAYLLFMAAVGYYVRFFGGDWGRALQLGLLFGALVLLVLMALSASLRARIRIFINKHFFSYRYDYREEWLRFTATLSTRSNPQEVGGLVIRGLADLVECPGGTLWTRVAQGAEFEEAACWNAAHVLERESGSSALCNFLREKNNGWSTSTSTALHHVATANCHCQTGCLPGPTYGSWCRCWWAKSCWGL